MQMQIAKLNTEHLIEDHAIRGCVSLLESDTILACSSTVEHSAVNRGVVGSNPT